MNASAEQLQQQLRQIARTWEESSPDNFRNRFFLRSPVDALARIFQGALNAIDASNIDAHQPLDIISRIQGIANVYEGRFRNARGDLVSGPGLVSLIRGRDPKVAVSTTTAIERALQAARSFGSQNSRDAVSDFNSSIRQLTRELRKAAELLELDVENTSDSANQQSAR